VTLLMALLLSAAGPDPDAADEWRAELPAGISIEDPQDPDNRKDREDRERRQEKPKYGLGLQVQGRWSLPFGSANGGSAVYSAPGGGVSVVFDSSLSWSDLFTSGWGTSITAEVTVVRAGTSDGGYGKSKNNFSVGGYLSLLQNHLSGQRVTDDVGNSITADDLTMESYLVGATMYQNMGNNVYTEGRFGIGAVHYSAVNATYTSSFPFTQTFDGELFKDTWNFALELRGGVGYRIGPLGVSIGMGFQLMAPPHVGNVIDLSPGVLMTWDIDLGIELGF
jgi:hypothetical protein